VPLGREAIDVALDGKDPVEPGRLNRDATFVVESSIAIPGDRPVIGEATVTLQA
jgi:hypothetical protein